MSVQFWQPLFPQARSRRPPVGRLRGPRRRRHGAPRRRRHRSTPRPAPTPSAAAARTCGAAADALHFVWTKLEGDVAIEADVAFVGPGKNAHRKAMLMIRQGLEADARLRRRRGARRRADVDPVPRRQGRARRRRCSRASPVRRACASRSRATTRGSTWPRPARRCGSPAAPHASRSSGPIYVGLGVCAHDKDEVVTATFSKVDTAEGAAADDQAARALQHARDRAARARGPPIAACSTSARRASRRPTGIPTARRGSSIPSGKLLKIPMGGGAVETVNTGIADPQQQRPRHLEGRLDDRHQRPVGGRDRGARRAHRGSTRCRSRAASRRW